MINASDLSYVACTIRREQGVGRKDGAKMVAVGVNTKPAETIP
jgi:hypothetical protein